MSIASESALPTEGGLGPRSRAAPIVFAFIMALAIIAMTIAPMAVETVREATLFDNDDAMRLVELRDWMGGQSWFDLNEHRVNPPTGMMSHWSRLIELPIAGLIRILSVVVDPDLAERIAVAVWPCVLLGIVALVMLCVAARLFVPPTLLAAAVMLALNPLFMFQLLPGRIDHHGVQMLLSLALAFATLRAIADRRAGAAAVAGAIGGLSLAIGLETVPLVALAAALFGIAFIVDGARSRRVVASFGATFALGTLFLFAVTAPPSRFLVVAADQLSPPWLWMAAGGGGALGALTFVRWESMKLRAAAAVVAGVIVAGVFVALWPHMLAGPLADIDPLVGVLWLDGVGEAKPLPLLIAERPEDFLYFLLFPTLGSIGLAAAALAGGTKRLDFLILLAFAAMGLVLALGQMRGASFASLFAFFGWLYPIDRAFASFDGGANRRRVLLAGGTVAAVVALSLPYAWSALGAAAKANPAATVALPSCNVRGDMEALAAEPRGLVLAPLRLGPRILVATDHNVIAAPYHRNNLGNRFALETLTAAPDVAHARIKARGVRYLAVCVGDTDLPRLLAYRENSLLKRLVDDAAPPWLSPLPARGPIRAWRVAD